MELLIWDLYECLKLTWLILETEHCYYFFSFSTVLSFCNPFFCTTQSFLYFSTMLGILAPLTAIPSVPPTTLPTPLLYRTSTPAPLLLLHPLFHPLPSNPAPPTVLSPYSMLHQLLHPLLHPLFCLHFSYHFTMWS